MKDPARFCILLAFLILILSYQTFPQTIIPGKIQFNRINSDGNTPLNFIWCVFQDSKDFIWIGTSDGLLRYDGLKFKIYTYSPNDVNSIGSNTIRTIIEDKNGIIWVGTGGGGLNRYNYVREKFTRYVYNRDDSASISSNYIYTIYEDKSGTLWIGTELGLNSFNSKTGEFICYKNEPEDPATLSNNTVTSILEDSNSKIWIGTANGLNVFDRKTKTFNSFFHDPNDSKSLNHNKITGICEDNFGNIWVSTLGGGLSKLIYYNKDHSAAFVNFKNDPNNTASLSDNNIAYMYLDKNNILWLGTWGGGVNKTTTSLDRNSYPSFISFKHNPNGQSSLSSDNVSYLIKDNSGLLWIGTWGGGLHLSNLKQKQFEHYKNEPDNPSSLSANGVMSIIEDRAGIVWIGTWDGGLNKWDRTADKFTNYKHNANDPFSLSDNSVSEIYEDRYGILWIGTWNGGLNKFDRTTGKFYHFRHNPGNYSSISDDRILSIIEDDTGTLWIGTYYGGLNKLERESKNFYHYLYNPRDPNGLSSTDVHELFIDKSGLLWIGTKHGTLDVLNTQKGNFIHYKNDPDNKNSLSDNKISEIFEDRSGVLWIGTQGGGLNKYDRATGHFRNFRMRDGIAGDFITGILEDENNNLWISTSSGLSRFNIQTESFRNYYVEDGLQSNEFEELNGCYKCKTGELIFGGINGFNIFYPDSIKDNHHIPPVYITDFQLFNKPVPIGYDSLNGRTILRKSLIECKEIELNYDDNVFSFEFAALDYHAPMNNKYAYIMEGFDKNWTYTAAKRNLATYTNLDPGEYTFRVKGSNNDGIWNEEGASIKIIILPPWYRTMPAYLIYILFICSTIYIIWKTQLKKIKIRNEYEMGRFEAQKLHEVDELKSRFFTNISHEFRTPLTLILGPAKQLFENIKDDKIRSEISLIHKNARKLLELVNQLLDISKLESGNMKLQTNPQDIVSLLKALVMSFSSYAERKSITLKFNSVENEIIVYLDKDKIEKIITNILSNAFKFTADGGKIETIVRHNENYVDVSISDTGIGIPKEKMSKIFDRFYQVDGSHTREKEGTGIGLSLTKELVELHKGKIEVESEEGKGTTFTVSIPLGTDHLEPEEISKEEEEYEKEEERQDYYEETENKTEQQAGIGFLGKEALPLLLIIEDNSDVRRYIKNNLKKEYRVLESADGEDGWNKSIEQIPDLIISDVMMPKIDGFKLCEKLKTDERSSHIPIILLTAKAAKEDRLTGYETGADEYLMKPFEPDELRARIKNLIEQRKRLHRYFRKEGLFELSQVKITRVDKMFLQQAYDIVSQNISNESFGVEVFAENLSVSKSLLYKKIVSLTGEAPVEFIRRIRLNKAAKLIENKSGNLSGIALEVGFNNPSYFAECFKKQFGVTPSQYNRNNKTSI